MNLIQRRIGVLMGGWNREREVSLNSGHNVTAALQAKGHDAVALDVADSDQLLPALDDIDVVFNCLHGGVGEDGTLQALLDVIGRPYTGSGMMACALAMDKLRTKQILRQASLRVADEAVGGDPRDEGFEAWFQQALAKLGLPLVVKPVGEGSSLGVHIVQKAEEFAPACRAVHEAFGAYFAEAFVPGVEVTAGVLQLDEKNQALPLLELRPKRAFYDYEAKYTPGMTEFVTPAELDAAVTRQVQAAAVRAHEALGCEGYSRVDFRISDGGKGVVLEVNTSPGMTNTSDFPQVAEAAGIGFEDLVERMLLSAFQKDTRPPALEEPTQAQV